MKKLSLLIALSLPFCLKLNSQSSVKHFTFEMRAVTDLSENRPDFSPRIMIREMPKQGASSLSKSAASPLKQSEIKARPSSLPGLIKGQSFLGNPFGVSTPCDNDLAISDSGMVISVINTNIYCRNIVTNSVSPVRTLAYFTTPINNNHQEFDPKVMYDPESDRFVLVCLVGNVDTTSKVILGFSQTNNPAGSWNLYELPGDPLNQGLWTDYPMIAMTKKELFLTVNLLYNDSSWQSGFVETLVWQINKSSGYNGAALASDLHSNIGFNGRAIRNLCPVKGGSQLYSPNMYFISNRNLDAQNDTVFLVSITDTIGAPGTTVTTQVLKSNQDYYFPPDARQVFPTQFLATNDSRNLGAFYENGKIQYVHNTRNPANNLNTVYYGVISNPQSSSPSVSGYLLANDTMDFAYPNISYSGNSSSDDRAIITFDHSSNLVRAGVSGVQVDGTGAFSPILRIQNGVQAVNLLQSNLERWGDYSGSQRKYNNPGEVWMSGYYGYSHSFNFPYAHAAWIAQLTQSTVVVPVDTTSLLKHENVAGLGVYPNPAEDLFMIEFKLSKPEYLRAELFDANGKLIQLLLSDWIKGASNVFSFSTRDLQKGVYFITIRGNNETNLSKKIIVN